MKSALACFIAVGLTAAPAAAQLAPSDPEACRASIAEVAPFMETLNTLSDTIDGIARAASRNTMPVQEMASLRAAQDAFNQADHLSDAGDAILERVVRYCGTRAVDPVGEIRAAIGWLRQVIAIGRLSAQVSGRVR